MVGSGQPQQQTPNLQPGLSGALSSRPLGGGLSGGLSGGLTGGLCGGLTGGLSAAVSSTGPGGGDSNASGTVPTSDAPVFSGLSALAGLLDTASAMQQKEEELPAPQQGGRGRRGNNFDSGRWGGGGGGGRGGPRKSGFYDASSKYEKAAHDSMFRTSDGTGPTAKGPGPLYSRPDPVSKPMPVTPKATDDATSGRNDSRSGSVRRASNASNTSGAAAQQPTPPSTTDAPSHVSSTPSSAPGSGSTGPGPAAAGPVTETRSTGGWRPKRGLTPQEQLKRDCKGFLNRLTVDNFPTVGEKFCKRFSEITTANEVGIVAEMIVEKAGAEPDFSQLYADLCLVLSYRCPASVVDATGAGKTPQQFFSNVLIDHWSRKFESLVESVASVPADSGTGPDRATKKALEGMCVILAEFVVRNLTGLRAFNLAASTLLQKTENFSESNIEGLCQMLATAGAFLDNKKGGKAVVDNCFGRLAELSKDGLIGKRVNCLIQDLQDARNCGWHKKVHKDQAKALENIKQDLDDADLVGGAVVTAQFGTVVQLGERSNLVENKHYAQFLKEQEEMYLARQSG